ncbi:MAG: murein DD-endopeptidase MepM/ murein hydrolase activator NlpD [Flammeovirgaceae bacterium]|jgi:murein DD-endopeptidase MepM/ murein hydrolase activator NlpD
MAVLILRSATPSMRNTFIFFITVLSFNAFGQNKLADFAAPLEIPLFLSGNFAELRSNHFHTGIDIKTQGVEGLKVLAADQGKVSRISVSPYGYGLALYIEHPNGYTTVYGHLQKFNSDIARAVRKKQYEEESFRVDFAPTEELLVERGELIALSGNTGGSGGPHLHFEIRRTADSHPLNPLKFGFDIKDDIPPRIRGVRFHPMSDSTLINGKHEAKSLVVQGSGGKYHLKAGSQIEVYGAFGISIHSLDYLNGYPNKCGLYEVHLSVDDETVCRQQFDELDFATTRHINAYKAYDVYRTNKWHYHKSFIEPGNELKIYLPETKEMGVIHYTEAGLHQARYIVKDAYENISTLNFPFEVFDKPNGALPEAKPYDAYFNYNQENTFTYPEEFEVTIPKGALYKDLKLNFGREMQKEDHLSARYTLHNDMVPLDDYIQIAIRAVDVPEQIRDKVLAAQYSTAGGASYITGKWEEDRFIFKSKSFGKFALVADSVAPEITPLSRTSGSITDGTVLSFRIKDDLSGIGNYNAYLNGEWVLTAFEPKSKAISVIFEGTSPLASENELRIEITDAVGNKTERVYKF